MLYFFLKKQRAQCVFLNEKNEIGISIFLQILRMYYREISLQYSCHLLAINENVLAPASLTFVSHMLHRLSIWSLPLRQNFLII